jgi:single-strand DNA-binding protein
VVIDRFRGDLTLLDSAGGGESGGAARPARAPGSGIANPDGRPTGGMGNPSGQSWEGGKAGGDLDDDIPF